jgi:hypothetical protein
MNTRIISTIAGAVASAVRRLGPVQAHVVVGPVTERAPSSGPDGTPSRDTALIRIDVNLNR